MGHNVTRAQGLPEELAQRRASLLQESTEAQALKGQEELLAEMWKKKWLIRPRYQSCPIYISDRLRKLGLSLMKLRDVHFARKTAHSPRASAVESKTE